jgi:aspartate/methionine/tyrosine aminotransferase
MNKIPDFALERYFAHYEFSTRYLLSSSDCESLSLKQLLELADDETDTLWKNLQLGYTESAGFPPLRSEIAGEYHSFEEDNILTIVPEEGIYITMQVLLQTGDHIISTFPGYQSLYEIGRAKGCEVSFWQPVETDSGWRFDTRDLKKLIREDTSLVVINFPHNPTGCVPSLSEFEEILAMVSHEGIPLFSDEIYRNLEYSPKETLPSACTLYDGAITLSGLSKAYGLPGLRTGWLATKDMDVLGLLRTYKDYTTICASGPTEVLALIALQNKERILSGQLKRLHRNLKVMKEFFSNHHDLFDYHPPDGSSVCFPAITTGEGASRFCEHLIEQTGIMLVPSSIFDFGDRFIRIGFGRQNLPEVLEVLDDFLEKRMI